MRARQDTRDTERQGTLTAPGRLPKESNSEVEVMGISEIEHKIRELRQLQALIEEAEQEAEAIKDALKAHMGDAEEMRAGA